MRRTSWLTTLLVATLLAGSALIASCHYDIVNNYCTPTTACGKQDLAGASTQPPPVITNVYSVERDKVPDAFFVAIDPKGICADIPGVDGHWIGRVVVPRGNGSAHCAYVWHGDTLAAAPYRKVFDDPQLLGLETAQLDAPAMGIQQASPVPAPPPDPEMDPATRAKILAAYYAESYKSVRARLGEALAGESPAQTGSVRVAVVDSAGGNFYGPEPARLDSIGHGRAVGRLIEDVACKGQQPCRVEISNYAALPLMTGSNRVLQIHGSGAAAYGTRGYLAEQIERAASDWQQARDAGAGPEHLVINLSLGWSGCFNASDYREREQDMKRDLVYEAILRATCRGAIVVAAAGNIEAVPGCPVGSPGAGKTGEHVYPAKFLKRGLRPDAAKCHDVGIDVSHAETLGPLLFGVSAVDDQDRQLSVAEQESTLVAYGSAIVVPDGETAGAEPEQKWTSQLSGTSMSAATVSGIAAAVWAAFPARTPAQLEADLIEPAIVLNRQTPPAGNFICNALPQGQPECQTVRRATLCRSLAHANNVSSKCGPPAAPLREDVVDPSVGLAAGANSRAAVVAGDPQTRDTLVEGHQCVEGAPSSANCPKPGKNAIDSTEQQWAIVGPQPMGNSCGTCQFTVRTGTFKAVLRDGTAFKADPGWVSLQTGDWDLWSGEMTSMSVSRNLKGATWPKNGKLWYIGDDTSAGPIYYYEAVTIIPPP